MTVQSSRSRRPTSASSHNATSSPGSADGAAPFDSRLYLVADSDRVLLTPKLADLRPGPAGRGVESRFWAARERVRARGGKRRAVEPGVRLVAHGVSGYMDQMRGSGQCDRSAAGGRVHPGLHRGERRARKGLAGRGLVRLRSAERYAERVRRTSKEKDDGPRTREVSRRDTAADEAAGRRALEAGTADRRRAAHAMGVSTPQIYPTTICATSRSRPCGDPTAAAGSTNATTA
jgi:hypothetical protein